MDKKVRKEIKVFAKEMERVMAKHDKRKGDLWKKLSVMFLDNKLKNVFNIWDTTNKADNEMLIDIANYCMMLYIRLEKKEVE